MTCGCEKQKPKGGGKSFTKAVVEINNPSKITLLRKVVIPASLGDETTIPPAIGEYHNVVLYYEATKTVYLYSSDGIPTLITTDISSIEEAIDQLREDLAQEAEDREDADSELADSIDEVASDLASEIIDREDADSSLQGQIDDHTTDISNLSSGLEDETHARQDADTDLQGQIDAISAASDVKDIVGTYAELQNYDTSTLGNNDIIKVLQDETQDDATTYYRWSTSTETFSLIGEEGPYYTKSQTNSLLDDKQNTLVAGSNISIVNDTISAVDTTYSAGSGITLTGTTFSADTSVVQAKLTAGDNITINGATISATDTTYTAGTGLDLTGTEFSIDDTLVALKTDLPTVNDATLTVQKNGTSVGTFTANSSTDTTINITVPTNNSELTNGAGYQTASDVQTAISGKQDTLTAGTNISITNNTISATDTTYTAGNGLNLTGTVFSADTDILQTKLTAGDNISISNGVISSTGPTYSAGTGLDLTNSVFSIDDTIVALKTDIPTISTATLTIQKNGTDVATFTTNDPNPVTANITVPTDTSELTNGAGYQTASGVQTLIAGKQDILTAGNNIQINNNTISATDTTYTGGTGIYVTGTVISADTDVLQTKLTAGNNITISSGTISATDTTYSNFTGADGSSAGSAGLVPAPAAGDNTKYLSGDGTWKTVPIYDLPIASASTLGGVKVGTGLSIDSSGVLSSTGLTSVDWSDIENKPNFATVATSGSYNDLLNKPTIPTVNDATLTIQKNGTSVGTFTANASSNATIDISVPTKTSDLNNDSGFIDKSVNDLTNYTLTSGLATVATTGSYTDLTNKPSIPAAQIQSDWTQSDNTKLDYIKNKPTLATVATSGSYNDLSNKPTIPAAQVNSDWNASSGVAQILNKPSLATVATTGAYSDLSGTPTIPTVNDATLTITQNGTSAGTFTANASSNATIALTDTTYSAFTGTDGTSAGAAGLVPAPATTDAGKFLKADGTWATVGGGSSNFAYYTLPNFNISGNSLEDSTMSLDSATLTDIKAAIANNVLVVLPILSGNPNISTDNCIITSYRSAELTHTLTFSLQYNGVPYKMVVDDRAQSNNVTFVKAIPDVFTTNEWNALWA